ncbi:uncharacterized protein LOC133815260 [Humulus lupulus]|uniref:uncharacterized protein LOC133815260 n=1 Tax=Humulus lupulus TaxID=3486 RepID=UPI002B40A74A|nr:uncharacterized protein LOC133815260 [Humulus lupulus]
MSKKRRLEDFETVKLTEECSAILQKKLPQKVKDPGSFTIPCTIGGSSFDKALCDLGASINLMPLSVFKKLGVGEVKPTTITLQLADRSLTYPRGVIEDVLVKMDKFIFPADFVVLDMEEDHEIPIILGRPFLATGRALIDVQGGHLTLRVNNEEVKFNIYQALQQHDNTSTCHRVDSIEVVVEETMRKELCADPLLHYLNSSITQADLKKVNGEFVGDEVAECVMALSAIPCASSIKVEETLCQAKEGEVEKEVVEKKDLKQLPEHLRYEYLGENFTCPVIISSKLSECETEKLLRVLRKYKSSIGWEISDMKGISPTVCMHKILFEENYKPSIEHQRRLNPAMKEVVRAEVLKLLNAGIIYAISDSS